MFTWTNNLTQEFSRYIFPQDPSDELLGTIRKVYGNERYKFEPEKKEPLATDLWRDWS